MRSLLLLLILFLAAKSLVAADILQKYFDAILGNSTISEECSKQFTYTYDALTKRSLWSLKMLDATAKLQSGILYGNIMHMGNYDECLDIKEEVNDTLISGKYCSVMFKESSNNTNSLGSVGQTNTAVNSYLEELRQSWGLCVPSACEAKDLQILWNALEDDLQLKVHLTFIEDLCDYTDKPVTYSPKAIFAISFLGVFLIVAIASTIYDFISQKTSTKVIQILACFSLYSNGKKLFAAKNADGNIGCLNGIRVLSMCWILLCHRFMDTFFLPLVNLIYVLEWKNNIENTLILSGNMAVDTFFTVSGLLVAYIFLVSRDKGAKFGVMFFVHRYLRLTPALAVVVLVHATVLEYVGRGPLWPVVYSMFQENCEKNWWSTLLYVQNYVHPNGECVGQSWYLAVDTQLYFLSPLLLFPIMRWPKRTIAVTVLLTLGSAFAAFAITWINKFGSIYFDENADQFKYYFAPTHIRMSPWLVGFICGYLLYKNKKKPCNFLNKKISILLWIIALAIILAIVLGAKGFTDDEYDVVESSVFNAFARPSWAVAICLITFLCVNGYGGVINSFLSAKAFTVLIRLNYSMYLLHLLVLAFFIGQEKTPKHFSNMHTYHNFWGDFVYTAAISVPFTLIFESPVIAIEKIIFRKNKVPDAERQENNYVRNISEGVVNVYALNNKEM